MLSNAFQEAPTESPVAAAIEERLQPFFAKPPADGLAVFDFDNTCILNDAGEAVYHHLVNTLQLKWSDALYALIGSDYHADEIAELVAQLQNVPADTLQQHKLFTRYQYLMLSAYYERITRDGIQQAYPWAVRILTGFTEDELMHLARTALEQELQMPLGAQELAHPESPSASLHIAQGIRPQWATLELMQRCRSAGCAVWIVSASNRWAVHTALDLLNIEVDGVVAMDVAINNGTLSTQLIEPMPVAEGKVAAIQHYVGRPPHLVFGDSANDYPMMRTAQYQAILIDHGHTERHAVAQQEGWLLQPTQ